MSVTYRSTRGAGPADFLDVALAGPAPDGGLYVPTTIPKIDLGTQKSWAKLSFSQLGLAVLSQFVCDDQIPRQDLERLVTSAFDKFRSPNVAPLVKLEEKFYLLELFHGPTFAFKDVAMTFLGELFEYILKAKDKQILILGATSGDTGSSAMASMFGRPRIRCLILYPAGRTSQVQEDQMLELAAREDSNVFCLSIQGTFDDCQRLVKESFGSSLRDKLGLAAINSMNWVRVLTQMVYYWWAALQLDAKLIDVCIPTGNFGNALAAWFAREMGAPIRQIVIATNSNDILAQFISTGTYLPCPVKQTLSPSMDIQIASNFERFVDFLYNKDTRSVANSFAQLANEGKFKVSKEQHELARTQIFGFSSSDEETVHEIGFTYKKCKYVLDPHTAVAVSVCRRMGLPRGDVPVVVPATAHWAKFPEAVTTALGAETFSSLKTPSQLSFTGKRVGLTACEPKFSALKGRIARMFGTNEGLMRLASIDVTSLVLPVAVVTSFLMILLGRWEK